MSIGSDLIRLIAGRHNLDDYQKKHWTGSFPEYLDIIRQDPVISQAKLIAEHDVPFRVAIGLVKSVTPAVLRALVSKMSPQEVINNLASLRRRGALDNVDLKALVESKLAEAKKNLEDMNPQKRLVLPEEVADCVAMLCGEGARSINGQAIEIDGGQLASR